MKILSIKGKNLASIEGEFIIDFRCEPLRSAGIFAITGSTGAGKTTLLDAMCIALFNKSPRTYKAIKSSEKEYNGSISILRNGSVEGYAEVEFLALNGKEYRSRWSVKRARNRVDGNIQDAKCELFCITENQYITTKKRDFEKEIEKLLGLNYEQFTRAVLLAQGEFSAFLKASPNEKADILEKLTGTDIYALISERIFQKTKEADSELNIIKEKLKEIALLSPEECAQLEDEKNNLEKASIEEEENISGLNEKIKWINRSRQLHNEREEALKSVEQCIAKLETMSDTVKTLEQTDIIQPIRDTYTQAKRIAKDIKTNETAITDLQKRLSEQEEQHKTAETKLEECKSRKEEIERKKAKKEPLIIEATKIETECNSFETQLQENRKLLSDSKKQLAQNIEESNNTYKSITINEKELQEIKQWFDTHATYSTVIKCSEVLSTSIKEAKFYAAQIASQEKILEKTQQQIELFEQHLLAAKEESEKLKATLTLEIATLRKRLVDGEPCPVCGSCNHQTALITGNILNEKELEKARRNNEINIERLNSNIERTKAETVSLTSLIEEYKKIYSTRTEYIISLIENLPYDTVLKSENLQIESLEEIVIDVINIVNEWNAKSSRTTELEQKISVERNTFQNSQRKEEEIKETIVVLEETIKNLTKNIKECELKLRDILGDAKSVSEISDYFRNVIERYKKELSVFTQQRNESLVALTETKQTIKTLENSILEQKSIIKDLEIKVKEFLAAQNNLISNDMLEKLTQITIEECMQMRRSVTTARENLLQAKAKLQERERNLELHAQATIKPAEEENLDTLSLMLQELRQQATQRIEHITRISIKLNNDKENKIRTEKLRKECENAEIVSTDWKRLCDMFGSSKGDKFRLIAQGYTLDIMLSYANMHLKHLSNRYQLVRDSSDTLALMIIDLDMLSERRAVNTLSGGETFLVSLALALALSSLSSSNMCIESLFIDEGFGSLDSDTLRVAMEALEHLQSQGRKIGVISHLSNMIERIPTQISVTKKRGGKSVVEIKCVY